MKNDREQELRRLEKELLAGMKAEDDLLADLPIELLDTAPITWEAVDTTFINDPMEITPEDLMDYPEEPLPIPKPAKRDTHKQIKDAKKQEDRALTILMAIASFLCLGIIGVLIYWLEVFF